MAMSKKGFLTLGAHKMLHMPLLAHGVHHAPFNGPSASATDGDPHFIMAWQAVQLPFQLPCIGSQFLPAVGTVEMVWMVGVVLEYQRLLVDDSMAFLADIFPKASRFLTIMTGATQVSPSILDKPDIRQNFLAEVTAEALWMPAVIHGFDNSANDEFTTLMTARGKEHLKVMLTVLSSFKLIEESFWELLEALSAHETLFMVQLPVTVYDLLSGCKAALAALTSGAGQGIGHVEFCIKVTELLVDFHVTVPALQFGDSPLVLGPIGLGDTVKGRWWDFFVLWDNAGARSA